jgi:hypothetical protein
MQPNGSMVVHTDRRTSAITFTLILSEWPDDRVRLRCLCLPREQDAPEATDFRFPVALLLLLHQGVGLGQRLEAVCRMAQMVTDFRQQGAKVWDVQRCPGGPPGGI